MTSSYVDNNNNICNVLSYGQVAKLHDLMEDCIYIHGKGRFPTLVIKLRDLVRLVKDELTSDGVNVRDIRLSGGAASYTLDTSINQWYSEVDFIFGVDLTNQSKIKKIRNCVLRSLSKLLPENVNKGNICNCALQEVYVQKMDEVYHKNGDRWSLISLRNKGRNNLRLKFVDTMKRQFAFSVESFQITLDDLFTFYAISKSPMNENFYPSLTAKSLYGNFQEACSHLDNKLIAARNSQEIRDGDTLLKYCNLLVRGYTPANWTDVRKMERCMCSRFFIDFKSINQQRDILKQYLEHHFNGDNETKHGFLLSLCRVIQESAMRPMADEQRQTLTLIQQLVNQIYHVQEWRRCRTQTVHLQQLIELNKLVIDKVFFGPFDLRSKSGQLIW